MGYENLAISNGTLGPLYYVVWSVLIVLILLNVFIAILSEAYAQVTEELRDEKMDLRLGILTKNIASVGNHISQLTHFLRISNKVTFEQVGVPSPLFLCVLYS